MSSLFLVIAKTIVDEPISCNALGVSDHSHSILFPDTSKTYPVPIYLDDKSLNSDQYFFGRALWLDLGAVERAGIIERYVYSNGFPPG